MATAYMTLCGISDLCSWFVVLNLNVIVIFSDNGNDEYDQDEDEDDRYH